MCVFFFNDTATTEIYTLSLHDALPILRIVDKAGGRLEPVIGALDRALAEVADAVATLQALSSDEDLDPRGLEKLEDRKSTRLNSSHANISYAVFCLKKKRRLHNNSALQ